MDNNFLYFYQHLPYHINPDLSIGLFSVSWYSIMYLVAFLVVYLILRYRIKNNEIFNGQFSKSLVDFLIYAFIGLIIGARIGYVLFYNLPFYVKNPLSIISPFDPATHQFIGIYGMSYHGGLLGVLLAAVIFCKKYKLNFWSLANFISPAIPAGYFFGRVGNFINGELYGRVTTASWGMYFPGAVEAHCNASLQCANQLRHPSQLYEAILEGVILFIILWSIRNKYWARDNMLAFYLFGYATARFIAEFFRSPDPQIGLVLDYFTLGQIFSILMIVIAAILFSRKAKNLL